MLKKILRSIRRSPVVTDLFPIVTEIHVDKSVYRDHVYIRFYGLDGARYSTQLYRLSQEYKNYRQGVQAVKKKYKVVRKRIKDKHNVVFYTKHFEGKKK